MKVESNTTQRIYDDSEAVYFRNIYQSAFYIEQGCTLLDVFTSSNGKLVFAFSKEEHDKTIKLWIANKDNPNNHYHK